MIKRILTVLVVLTLCTNALSSTRVVNKADMHILGQEAEIIMESKRNSITMTVVYFKSEYAAIKILNTIRDSGYKVQDNDNDSVIVINNKTYSFNIETSTLVITSQEK